MTFGVDDIRSFNSSCSELFSGQDALMGTRICGSNYLNFQTSAEVVGGVFHYVETRQNFYCLVRTRTRFLHNFCTFSNIRGKIRDVLIISDSFSVEFTLP